MNKVTQNFLLLLVGATTTKIALDGTYLRYVKPSLHWLLLAAGLVVLGLAVVEIVRDMRRAARVATADAHAGHHHGGGRYWLLLVPTAVVLFLHPPALGAQSVGTVPAAPAAAAERIPFRPLPAGDVVPLKLRDLINRATRDSTSSLNGRQIETSGFLVATADGGSPRLDGTTGGVDLARIVITCCAADARSIRIHLSGALGEYPDGAWVVVRGTVVPDSAVPATGNTPTFEVTSIRPIPEPENTYQY